jgi:hypothetical protein
MRTTGNPRSRRLALSFIVLAGPWLAACGTPVTPTALEPELGILAADGGKATKSEGSTNLRACRNCAPAAADPFRVPPNKVASLTVTVFNTGETPVEVFGLALFLVDGAGRRIPLSDTEHLAPRPGAQTTLSLRFVVPSDTPGGRYLVEAVVDPHGRIAEFDETDNTWLSPDALHVAAF